MITIPTTLVLGAGASVPYCLPTGAGLRQTIIDTLTDAQSRQMAVYDALGLPGSARTEFLQHFVGSGFQSIDAFLEHQPQFLPIGRTAIALALIPCEQANSVLRVRSENLPWYHRLFEAMKAATVEEWVQNRLRIVTFNYDRSLEFALFNHIKYSRSRAGEKGLPDPEVAQVLSEIPIVHVYGQLGKLPWQGGGPVRSYEPDLHRRKVEIARDEIRLISEREAGDGAAAVTANVRLAQSYLEEAERIYFLGFSFDETNLQRLNIERARREVMGTALGLGRAKRESIIARLPMQLEQLDVDTFLHEFVRLDRRS